MTVHKHTVTPLPKTTVSVNQKRSNGKGNTSPQSFWDYFIDLLFLFFNRNNKKRSTGENTGSLKTLSEKSGIHSFSVSTPPLTDSDRDTKTLYDEKFPDRSRRCRKNFGFLLNLLTVATPTPTHTFPLRDPPLRFYDGRTRGLRVSEYKGKYRFSGELGVVCQKKGKHPWLTLTVWHWQTLLNRVRSVLKNVLREILEHVERVFLFNVSNVGFLVHYGWTIKYTEHSWSLPGGTTWRSWYLISQSCRVTCRQWGNTRFDTVGGT